jgi:hypothetical protein
MLLLHYPPRGWASSRRLQAEPVLRREQPHMHEDCSRLQAWHSPSNRSTAADATHPTAAQLFCRTCCRCCFVDVVTAALAKEAPSYKTTNTAGRPTRQLQDRTRLYAASPALHQAGVHHMWPEATATAHGLHQQLPAIAETYLNNATTLKSPRALHKWHKQQQQQRQRQ